MNTDPNSAPADSPEKEILTKAQLVAAATNDPDLAKDQFKLGDRTFKIVDLEYDEYLLFTSYIEPLLRGAAGLVTTRAGVSVPGLENDLSSIDAGFLMKFCSKSLPEMAVIVCNMQEHAAAALDKRTVDQTKLVDVAWVKKAAKNPMVLAGIVMRQINQNNMIMAFMDFFVQVLPTVLQLNRIKNGPSTTKTTPSS